MASGRRGWDSSHEDDLPVYLARPGTTDQVPRQKYGGMFCNVEGAFESKTLDFDALSVGQRGAKTPRSSQGSGRGAGNRPGVEGDARRGPGREESREPAPESPKPAGVEIRSATGKEVLQNLGPKDKVRDPGVFSPLALGPFCLSRHGLGTTFLLILYKEMGDWAEKKGILHGSRLSRVPNCSIFQCSLQGSQVWVFIPVTHLHPGGFVLGGCVNPSLGGLAIPRLPLFLMNQQHNCLCSPWPLIKT